MSYTAKRLIILLMAWGLIVFVGVTVRINLNTPPLPQPTPTAAPVVAAAPTPAAADVSARIATLQQTLDGDPNNGAAILELAGLYYQQQNWGNAIVLYQRVLTLDPHNVDVLAHLAAAQLYQLQFADAKETLTQAAGLAPQRADIHLLLGLALSEQTPPDMTGAKAEWTKVLTLAPGTPLAQQAQQLLSGGPQ